MRRVLAIGHEDSMTDTIVITSTFIQNNSYACILFDSGAEKSFMNHQFKNLLKQNPQTLDETFTVEMAKGKTKNTKDIFV